MFGKRFAIGSVAAGIFVAAVASGCSSTGVGAAPSTTTPSSVSPTPTNGSSGPTSSPQPTPTLPTKIPRTFAVKNFDRALTDVNPFVPMTPGIQSVMKGFVNVGGRRLPHVRIITILDLTKTVDGVPAILVLDQDFDGGQLTEQAIDYLAEDTGGNVWYVGSYTEAYEGGQFLNAQDAWLAGVNGAIPGLFLPGDPKTGTPPFTQTMIPGVEQTTAQVVKIDQRTCVPFKCYTGVAVIQEQGAENKYWAPGVGAILTEPLSGSAQETEELVNIKQLSSSALAELRAEALKLDRNASVQAPSVFGGTSPAERIR